MDTERTVGLIGIGLLGSALAERLSAGGYTVVGYDVQPGRGTAGSAAEVAAACRRVLLSLPNSKIAAAVLDGIEPHLRPGALIIDTTTGAPDDAARFAGRLKARGAGYVDATVGGSSEQMRRGEAIFICGAETAAFEECRDILACCSRQAFHVGPPGSGARMKLVTNLVLGLERAVLAEGLEYARASGIAPEVALEILKAGPAYSRPMDTKGQKMLTGDFTPQARLSQHLKDVRLILETGTCAGARLPLSELHRKLLEEVEAAGYGSADNSAIIKAFQKENER